MMRFINSSLFPACLLACTAVAAVEAEPYREPPAEVVALVDAERPPLLRPSPDNQWALLLGRDAMPSIRDLSRRMLRLAGERIDPVRNADFRTTFYNSLSLRPLGGGEARELPTPGRLTGISWSHDSRHFVYTLATDSGTELWAASTDPAFAPRRLTGRLNTVLMGTRWMPDGVSILCGLVPDKRGPEPPAPLAPAGPNVQETRGDRSPLRTYQDLLASPHDEALFDHYATAVPVRIHLGDGAVDLLGEAGLVAEMDPAPGGELILMTRIRGPYSYLQGWWGFPQTVEVIDQAGETVWSFVERPMRENIPIGGVQTGPRREQWAPHAPATLIWAEALDGGDPKAEVPHRDRWLTLAAPFDADPTELLRCEERTRGLTYFVDPALLASSEYDRDRRWTRTLLYDLARPEAEPRVLDDRSVNDRYADPGGLVEAPNDQGQWLVQQDGPWVTRLGSGASPEGLFPFVDQQNLATLETRRLWRCADGAYEVASRAWPHEGGLAFLTRHETPAQPPNYRLRHTDGRAPIPVTDFPDPQPQLRGVKKQLVRYLRDDGVELSATLYLPADYEAGQRLPLLIWAYPREYNDPKTAGQVTTSPHRFTWVGGTSPLHFLNQGYAVMRGATMPIIGDPETMNDTFVSQLVASAQAAIDHAVELGVADRDRVAIAGHSYGAFMTAHLLAYSDLFRAGIARSGAYNRTLTPFGFQAERRPFWEAKNTYIELSPFMQAEKINEPVLLIHGEKDNNSGTYPDQSRRLYAAIKGNGGTARLVMLPSESHGYRARESVLHTLAESIDWLDEHVKHAPPREPDMAGDEVSAAEQAR